MAFSLLNGWQLSALNQTPSSRPEYHGEHSPGYSGRPFRRRRDIPRSWEFETKFADQNYCDTLEGLLAGRGHVINFEDGTAWTSQGVTPESGSVYTVATSPTLAVFGTGYLSFAAGDSIVWDPSLPPKWTVMWWEKSGGTAVHRVERSDGGKWLDGARDDSLVFSQLVVGAGGVAFTHPGGATYAMDDIVILPFVAHYTLIEEHYAASQPFSKLPCLELSGDIVGGNTVEVLGEVLSENHVQSTNILGARLNNSRQLRIKLTEKKKTTRKRLPAAAAAWYFHNDYRDGTTLSATNRLLPTATGVGLAYGHTGPYGLGQSVVLDGTSDWIDLPRAIVQNMAGASGYTVMSWLRIDTYSSRNEIIRLMLNDSGNIKLEVSIETNGGMRVRVRSGPTGGFAIQSFSSSPISTDTSRFHLWGASVDISDSSNAGLKLWFDGELVADAIFSGATEQTTFTSDAGSTNRFGANNAGGDELDGNASTLTLLNRVITVGEARAIFEAGREGVFV